MPLFRITWVPCLTLNSAGENSNHFAVIWIFWTGASDGIPFKNLSFCTAAHPERIRKQSSKILYFMVCNPPCCVGYFQLYRNFHFIYAGFQKILMVHVNYLILGGRPPLYRSTELTTKSPPLQGGEWGGYKFNDTSSQHKHIIIS